MAYGVLCPEQNIQHTINSFDFLNHVEAATMINCFMDGELTFGAVKYPGRGHIASGVRRRRISVWPQCFGH